jgi:SPP1 gp7 family putative phage head morphogenesis protein
MATKPKTARAVPANRGIEAKYRKQLEALIAEMHQSCEYWLTAAYRKNPPKVAALVDDVAQDAAKPGQHSKAKQEWQTLHSPAAKVRKVLDGLGERWIARFEDEAEKIAQRWLESMFTASQSSLKASLEDMGWAVEFKMTPAMKDALNASLSENVALIKSIPEQYLKNVEGAVMRSYSAGRDLETMTKEIKQIYPVTKRRAELIARDQSNKANAVVNRTRQMELGITDAVWMHSHAGKNPRPDHVAANGKRYKIAEGCLISGEYIHPGEEINCRCTSRPILPF